MPEITIHADDTKIRAQLAEAEALLSKVAGELGAVSQWAELEANRRGVAARWAAALGWKVAGDPDRPAIVRYRVIDYSRPDLGAVHSLDQGGYDGQ